MEQPDPASSARAPDGGADDIRAAIDVGTNSIHLVVARVSPSGGFEVLAREKESVRLGEGLGDHERLGHDAIDRGIAALTRLRGVADAHGAALRAVATSAVREALNGGVFVARARDEAGVAVDVISGVEEARLIHLGVLQAVPVFDRQLLVIDIGGGSTEFLVGRAGQVLAARSTKVGAIRLTDRFFPGGRIEKGSIKECRRWIGAFLTPVIDTMRSLGFQTAVGASGTITAVAALARRDDRGPPGRWLNSEPFTYEELEAVVDELTSARTTKARKRIDGLEEHRADIIVGGAVLLHQLFELLGIEEMVVSEYALREGLLLDAVHQRHGADLQPLHDIRRESVMRVAEAYQEDLGHVERGTRLSLSLFDGLHRRHELGSDERELLEAAGLLHNVGLFVSHAAHHRHSEYLIRHSDRLLGFTQREIEIIAQVARYHRKSAPKPSHPAFAALDPPTRATIRTLAGLLRIGIALDRTRMGAVAELSCRSTDDGVEIGVHARPGADITHELYTARARAGLLGDALDCQVKICSR